MASFALLVTHPPFDSQQAYSAYRFAWAALEAGHLVRGVFFYQAGVNNANCLQAGHSDELNMYDKWLSLAKDKGVPLQVCVTAANRRGIIDQQDAEDRDLAHFNLAAPFLSVGLGDLVELINQADRTIQF